MKSVLIRIIKVLFFIQIISFAYGVSIEHKKKISPNKATTEESSLPKIKIDDSYSHFNMRECEDYIIDNIPFSHIGTNNGFPDIVGNPSGDVVYYLNLVEFAMINISLCSPFTNYDTFLRIFDGCPGDAGVTELWYNDDGPTCDLDLAYYEPSLLENLIIAPGDYYIVIEGYSADEGDYGLNIEYETIEDCSGNIYEGSTLGLLDNEICNDGSDLGPNFNCCEWDFDYTDCNPTECEAINVTSLPFFDIGTNYCLPNIAGNSTGDLIYKMEVDETVRIDISLCSEETDFDAYLRVYDGCPIDEGSLQLGFNDDGPVCELDTAPYEPSYISNLELTVGEYYIVVDGFGANEGNFGITIDYAVFEDCIGTDISFNELDQLGDGICNDGSDGGPNFNCPEWNFDNTDCEGDGPDLVVDRDYLINTLYMDSLFVAEGDCYIDEGCIGDDGPRRVIRFGTLIGNIGTTDFVLGTPGGLNWHWDACHGHYHYEEYAYYQLFTLEGEELEIGFKSGWCVMDLTPFIDPPESGCDSYNCGYQGITAGCADIYHSGLDCQWLDLTDIEDDTYILKITTNPDEILYELNYHNNTAQVVIEISGNEVQVLDINPDACLDLGLNLDCSEQCFDNMYLDWIGDGFCDEDGLFGLDFNCNEWEFDGNDCSLSMPGDGNGDGLVNVLDAILLVNFILGNDEPTYNHFITLDLNDDGLLNILDVILLVSIIIG